jgi:hypothetical protein
VDGVPIGDIAVIRELRFEHGGREYHAHVGDSGVASGWWWFTVSGDSQRYAPFAARADDTRASVQKRICAYYDNLLARRAEPPEWRVGVPRRGARRP